MKNKLFLHVNYIVLFSKLNKKQTSQNSQCIRSSLFKNDSSNTLAKCCLIFGETSAKNIFARQSRNDE